MISYLRGTVLLLDGQQLVLEAGGVGYEVLLPEIEGQALRARLHRAEGPEPAAGKEAALWIYYHSAERQPRPVLIGFLERGDREFFELLLGVQGMGPVAAARSLTLPVCEYAAAIERRDVRVLGSLPGIGKRKAEQIVASLKGKAMPYALLPRPEVLEEEPVAGDFALDAQAILESLGRSRSEAVRMVEEARRRRPDIQETQALLEEILRGEQSV